MDSTNLAEVYGFSLEDGRNLHNSKSANDLMPKKYIQRNNICILTPRDETVQFLSSAFTSLM